MRNISYHTRSGAQETVVFDGVLTGAAGAFNRPIGSEQ